jgi:hypothetical protein
VDSAVDYDKFCLNNKENDKRKAMAVFIINLMKKELFNKKDVISTMIVLLDLVLSYVDTENKTNEVDEITENIFLLVSSSDRSLVECEKWNEIVDKIKTCSQYKTKEHMSISSRAIFKYKDICDLFKKMVSTS